MNRIYSVWSVLTLVALLSYMYSFAGDIDAGKDISTSCAGCHGQAGISPNFFDEHTLTAIMDGVNPG